MSKGNPYCNVKEIEGLRMNQLSMQMKELVKLSNVFYMPC